MDSNIIHHNYNGIMDEIIDSNNESKVQEENNSEAEQVQLISQTKEKQKLQLEQQKTAAFYKNYKALPEEKQKEILEQQKTAEKIIESYIKGEKEIQGLSQDERFILNKIKNEYLNFKKNNQDGIFSFDFANDLDKTIYSNLIYDISFRAAGLASPVNRIIKSNSGLVNSADTVILKGDKMTEEEGQSMRQNVELRAATQNLNGQDNSFDTKILTIEYLKQKENILTQADAVEAINIIQDWFNYGGDLYKHWTGRIIKLKKGTDYKFDSKGQVDIASYNAAVNAQAEEWLKQPVNRNWIAEANNFKKKNENNISFQKQTVELKDNKNNIYNEERYTTPYYCEEGWLIYESNYYDINLGAMTQKLREPSKYCIYFNMENQDIMRVYQDIIYKLNINEELSRVGFAVNTLAMFNPTVATITEAINAKDKIVLYVGEKGINHALKLIQEYIQKNKAKFIKKTVLLAQKLYDMDGKEVIGASISSDVKGVSPDASRGFPKYKSFNSMQVEIIQSTLNSIFKEIYNFDNLDKIGIANPALRDRLLEIGHDSELRKYLSLFLSQPSGINFLVKNLVRFYPKWSQAFGMSAHNIAFREEDK